MYYPKNNTERLDYELFKNPASEYRAAPFWAWNCKLEKDELLRQINCLKDMGFGGFNMHSRSGLDTKYLGDEYIELVSDCVDEAEKQKMFAWLYDEDRWPSGAAGGYVTRKKANRLKYIRFSTTNYDHVSKEEYLETALPYLVASFDIALNKDGSLKSYMLTDENAPAAGTKWYVFACMVEESGWYNNQTYADTMDKNAIQDFIQITHEKYKKYMGDKFGSTIPAIFTDEPQIRTKQNKTFSHDTSDVILPWTFDFADTFKDTYGSDIIEHLPELVWELPNNAPSQIRYRYHDHVCERFAQAFADQCGEWCVRNGIELAGHLMAEPSLRSQTFALGEAMRLYRSFTIPGIDMLCDAVELSTAKQAQSAVHQFGREAMLSELYGVTGWDFDFRGHKFQGDWQAALGVTIRVPHLSWVTMKGCAKRDYPASINYQVPWYKEYSYIENHFSRLNVVLTRGKPIVRVGVIHPIESFWLSFGAADLTAAKCDEMESNFQAIISRLLFGMIDFDFISESLMPSLYKESEDNCLTLGAMHYEAIVVPNLRTMRKSTLNILKEFKARGGKLIFIGSCPDCVDGALSEEVQPLFNDSAVLPSVSAELLSELSEQQLVSVYNNNGAHTDNLIYTLREDNNEKYLFIAQAKKQKKPDLINPQEINIVIRGMYVPSVLDTVNGEIKQAEYSIHDNVTTIKHTLYNSDSLLLRLSASETCSSYILEPADEKPERTIDFKSAVDFEREEPNVLILDMAEYSFDGVTYMPTEEILRIDKKIRERLGFPLASGGGAQPWTMEKEKITNFPYLRFTFESSFDAKCLLCYEEVSEVVLNGERVAVEKSGWYTDRQLYTMQLPKLKAGINELILRVPIGKSLSIENFFLLGDFDVEINGCETSIKQPRSKLAFGSVTGKGMPFYGGNLTYKTTVSTPECDIRIRANLYRGAMVRVYVDGCNKGVIAFAPYETDKIHLSHGEHKIEFKLFGNRRNTFSALHNCDIDEMWTGPGFWYSENDKWCYEYCLKNFGILASPVISVYNQKD